MTAVGVVETAPSLHWSKQVILTFGSRLSSANSGSLKTLGWPGRGSGVSTPHGLPRRDMARATMTHRKAKSVPKRTFSLEEPVRWRKP